MKPVHCCPICRSATAHAFRSKYRDVWKCVSRNCGHLFAPDAGAGEGLQGPDYIKPHYPGRDDRVIARLVRNGMLRDGDRVLDFGAGNGHISAAIKRSLPKASVLCVEASSQNAALISARGLDVIPSLDLASGLFDSVIMIEVIEHLDDPVEMLKKLRALMKADGRLFLTTPCGETRTGSRRTNAYDTPEHIHFFTEQSLRLALSSAGLRLPAYAVINEWYPRHTIGVRRLVSITKDLLRPVRARLLGYYHLIACARAAH